LTRRTPHPQSQQRTKNKEQRTKNKEQRTNGRIVSFSKSVNPIFNSYMTARAAAIFRGGTGFLRPHELIGHKNPLLEEK